MQLLGLNDFWSDKEDQLRSRCIDQSVLEQIAQKRNAAQQWYLCDSYAVLCLNDAADHHCATVRDQYLRGRLLCIERGVYLVSAYVAKVGGRIFYVHTQEDRIVRCDLRYHGHAQE